MKKLLALLLLLLIAFVVLNRRRLYLRDPLASVTRNGVAVSGVKVLINYPNDVLLDDSGLAAHRRLLLVQHWNQTLGTPTAPLKCVDSMACLLDADEASAVSLAPKSGGSSAGRSNVSMTSRLVQFVDVDGGRIVVKLH